MNRDHLEGRVGLLAGMELITQTAFHEAGHAAAIYLRNRHHNLPQIGFRIFLQGLKHSIHLDNSHMPAGNRAYLAKLDGGLLVENQALSAKPHASSQAILAYQQACEADMVNLLAGPLAEAKYVAQRDGENFNQYLVDYEALKNYGGKSDQEKIEEYIAGLGMPPLKKTQTLKELHRASFDFINQAHHWRAISRLANYIVDSGKEIIDCEEAIAILEGAIETNYCLSRC